MKLLWQNINRGLCSREVGGFTFWGMKLKDIHFCGSFFLQ